MKQINELSKESQRVDATITLTSNTPVEGKGLRDAILRTFNQLNNKRGFAEIVAEEHSITATQVLAWYQELTNSKI